MDISQEDFAQRLRQLEEQGEPLTFRKLAPPGRTSPAEATRLLFCMLGKFFLLNYPFKSG